MKNSLKRVFALLLVLVMVGSMLPVPHAHAATAPEAEAYEPSAADYAAADAVFAQIDEMEDAPAKKSATEKELADEAAALVMASDNYVEGSLERNGNSFTWWTDEGIRCVYSPRMREIESNMVAPETPIADGAYNEPVAQKGSWPSSNQVYLIAPYYGYDDSFTDQYKNEATSIASAIGDTDGYTLYSGTAATIDKVAEAMSNGAVVIFDSHGNTDYENGYDYVTGANYSYLCMTSTTGLTQEDYNDGALYYSDGIWINGASIANHMTSNSPAGILWMAICLGMATDTFAVPMREKGVEVVYGYSQSVTFAGDYLFEETFWDNMCAGKDVATSIAAMKSAWGNWDWSTQIATANGYTDGYSTISAARSDYAAFPIVVSDEDTHPGQRSGNSSYGADSLQTVKSTYTLFSQYEVTAVSNNASYGSVSVNGSTITATPATGYFAQSATVTSGTATVTQNGNTFSVLAESDCTVQINFAAKTPVTVTFSGATVAEQNGYAGDTMSLPTSVEAPEGYSFVGWTTAPLSAETTEKPVFYTDSFIPAGNITLYALYSYMEASSDGGSGDYVKVTSTSDNMSGEYVVVYEDGGLVMDSSLASLDANNNNASVTISDSTIAAAEGDPYKVTIAAMDGGYSIQTVAGTYISGTSGSNKLNTGTEPAANTISIDASGNATITSNTSVLRFNTDASRFRYYKSTSYSSQKAIALYVKDGTAGTTYYISTLCEHTNTTDVAAVAATCTEGGFTAGVQCADCGTYISGHEAVAALGHSYSDWTVTTAPDCENAGEQTHTCAVCGETETQSIAATGHSYNAVVTDPTATEQGYTTYTCSACGNSYVGDYVDALGETYTVSFVVPDGVTAVADMPCNNSGIVLPEAGIPTGAYSYAFAGWVTATVDNVDVAPEILAAGSTYNATSNTTLYALYSYAVGGSGSTAYVLTDIADISNTDSVVVTMTYTDGTVYALYNANGTGSAPTATVVTVADDKLSEDPAAELLWNIGGTTDAYIFYPEGTTATWLYCTDTNNGVRVGTDSANTFKIDAASGYLQHNSTSRYLGVYRTNPDWRCYTNTTGNTADQTLGFYVKGEAGTTYYTTVIVEPCSHENTTTTTVEVTCTTDGSTTVTCDDCGAVVSSEIVTATGHSYVDGTCSACGEAEPEVTEPEATEPEVSEPAGTVTSLQYVFSDYTAGTQYAQGENHTLDDVVTLTINGAHLNGQIRLYAGSNAVFTSAKEIDSIIVKAGNKAGTLNVYSSADGSTWNLVSAQATTTTYTNYSFDMPEGTMYVKLESVGAQIRVSEMTIDVLTSGTTQPEVTEPESTEPEVSEPESSEPEVSEPEVSEPEETQPVAGAEVTIDFSTTDQRVSLTTESQVWANGGATLTNNKASSTSNVADYSNPVRFYKSSEIIIAFPGMNKIEVNCNSAEYATALVNSISDSNAAVTQNGQVVTIVFTNAVDEISFTLSAQVRVNDLTVYREETCQHEYTSVVTAPTCTEAGYTTYTCSVCGDSYTADEVEALGHNYVLEGNTYTCSVCGDSYERCFVSFSVPEGVDSVADIECVSGGITLPAANAPEGYTFAGWVNGEVDNSTEKPEILAAGSAYETDAAVTLYAVYTYKVESENSDYYVKVTEAPADWSGEYLIVYEADETVGYVYNGSLDSQDTLSKANNYVELEIANGAISAEAGDPYKFIISASGDAYTIQSLSGFYIGRTASTNGLNASTDTVYTNTLSLDSFGHANIVSEAGTYLKFNSSGLMFRYYATGQQNIELYTKPTATVYYTTVITEETVSVESWNITLSDSIGLNFVMAGLAEGDEVAFYLGEEQLVATVDESGRYSIALAAAQMTDKITVKVNGKALEGTYSVRAYADVILAGDYSDATKNLVKAMLNYGAASQLHFGYNAENLANNGIDFTSAAPEGESVVATEGAVTGINFYGASLLHKDKIAVRFYFTGDITDCVFTDANGNTYTPTEKDGKFYVEVAGINPQDMDADVKITVTKGSETVSVGYSALDYIIRMYNKSADDSTVKALVQALYGYYAAAEAYTAQ